MASQVIKTTFQLKRGTAQRWTELNPILKQGEPGFEFDTNKLKIGDGLTAWNDLPYQSKSNVVNAPTSLAFPTPGEVDVIYKAENEKQLYQWDSENKTYEVLGVDVNEIYQLIADLSSSISTLEQSDLFLKQAIDILNADATQEGSVAYQVAQVVNGAPEEFNTLKKISDWIYAFEPGDSSSVINGITADGTLLNVIDKIVNIPIADEINAGLVRSSNDLNKIQVGIDGTMEVNSLGFSKLIPEEDLTVILNSGDSSED